MQVPTHAPARATGGMHQQAFLAFMTRFVVRASSSGNRFPDAAAVPAIGAQPGSQDEVAVHDGELERPKRRVRIDGWKASAPPGGLHSLPNAPRCGDRRVRGREIALGEPFSRLSRRSVRPCSCGRARLARVHDVPALPGDRRAFLVRQRHWHIRREKAFRGVFTAIVVVPAQAVGGFVPGLARSWRCLALSASGKRTR